MDEKETPLPMDEGPERPELADPPMFEPEPTPEPEKAAEEAKAEQPRGPDGKFASKDTGEAAPAATEAPPASEPDVPVKALQDERRKRQELERQLAAMQAQLNQPKPQEPPAFWDDPDKAIDTRIQGAVSQAIAAFQQQQTMDRINASEAQARVKHTDYDDAFQAFRQAANANPALLQQMTHAADPGEFAYQTGKRAMDLERVGSFEELLKAERAKWEAEAKAALPTPQFPVSTASDGTVGGRSGPAWTPTEIRLPMDG